MNFFQHHEVITLICLAIFPRLTLLIASFVTGGLLWWLGWIFAPRLLIAILAIPFFDANPVLVIIAWLLAFSGTSWEYRTVSRYNRRQGRR